MVWSSYPGEWQFMILHELSRFQWRSIYQAIFLFTKHFQVFFLIFLFTRGTTGVPGFWPSGFFLEHCCSHIAAASRRRTWLKLQQFSLRRHDCPTSQGGAVPETSCDGSFLVGTRERVVPAVDGNFVETSLGLPVWKFEIFEKLEQYHRFGFLKHFLLEISS